MTDFNVSNPASTPFERRLKCKRLLLYQILEQSRRNGDLLAAIKSCLDRHDQRFDELERSFSKLGRGLNGLELDGLGDDLRTSIRVVMHEVLDEHDKNVLERRR